VAGAGVGGEVVEGEYAAVDRLVQGKVGRHGAQDLAEAVEGAVELSPGMSFLEG